MIKLKIYFRFHFCEWGIEDEIYDSIQKPEEDHVNNIMRKFKSQRSHKKKLYGIEFDQLPEEEEEKEPAKV